MATLGTGADSIAAAKGLVSAEQNFNPLPGAIPNICNDPSLPATEALRGIVPLIDPNVEGSDVANAASAASVNTPLGNAGQSIADLLISIGFTNFKTPDGPAAGGAGGAAGGNAPPVVAPEAPAEAPAAPEVSAAPEVCSYHLPVPHFKLMITGCC